MTDADYMRLALEQADLAAQHQEVPIGAVLVHEGKVIASAYNQPITLIDPSAHAEILVLRQAAKALNNYRLLNTTLYVTIEPCAMCAMALVHARVKRLVYGAKEPRTGAVCSRHQLLDSPANNHKVLVESDVLANDCAERMQRFFKARRG